MLKVRGQRAVIVGGGKVAARRARSLFDAGAEVVIIAPAVESELTHMPVHVEQRAYEAGDLIGAKIVVIATDDPAVNAAAAHEAIAIGAMVNRADEPDAGDFIVPAHARRGPITLAVSTNGISARSAAVLRDQLLASIDEDWVTLLTTVEPFRADVQRSVADPARRTAALHKLTDPAAMSVLKEQGAAALAEHCRRVVEQA